jgi:hypothetical protein
MTIPLVVTGQDIEASHINSFANAINDHVLSSWTSYSPTWTNLTVGNGTVMFEWRRVGEDLVRVRGVLVRGSTTSITGTVSLTLPSGMTSRAGAPSIGQLSILDSGTRLFLGNVVTTPGTATLAPFVADGVGYVVNATSPMTWATGDELRIDITVAIA